MGAAVKETSPRRMIDDPVVRVSRLSIYRRRHALHATRYSPDCRPDDRRIQQEMSSVWHPAGLELLCSETKGDRAFARACVSSEIGAPKEALLAAGPGPQTKREFYYWNIDYELAKKITKNN